MRRAGGLWDEVVSFRGLQAAAWRAARGKRQVAAVARFLERCEPEVLRLQRELRSGEWQPGRASRFLIRDPKLREITVVPFRDRVVHHALIAPLEPVFERRMIFDSYACRKGKGTHAALARAQVFVRRYRYFLKLDVRSFFGSVRPEVARESLGRVIKDRRVLELCDRILRGCAGLPIGSLTSQWFANLVLDRLDHHVKERLKVRGYVRYMDDLALFADEKRELHAARSGVETFLADPLRLALKEGATMLAPVSEGLPFLGWRIFRGMVRLRGASLRRYVWRLRFRRWELLRGLRSEESYRSAVAAVFAHLGGGSTCTLRRALVSRLAL